MSKNYTLALLESEINDAFGDDDCGDFTKIVPNSNNITISYSSMEEAIAVTKRNRSGVVKGLPPPMKDKDGKIDKSQLTPIYMGAVDRATLAKIIVQRMEQLGWSCRAAVDETGLSKSTIQRLRSGASSLETYLEDAEKFGLSVKVALFDANEP